MPDLFKDVMPAIMHHKKNVFVDDDEKRAFLNKSMWPILTTLSMYSDCVMQANVVNMIHHVTSEMKYDFLLNTIRGYKRSYNYAKKQKHSDLSHIAEYYGVNMNIAKQYHDLLSPQDIEEIKTKLDKGGIRK